MATYPTSSTRPRSLAEVACVGAAGNIDGYLREFLDEFYLAPSPAARTSMLLDEPTLLEDPRANAYLAAVAEHLSFRNHLQTPAWTAHPGRFLRSAYFPAGLQSLKARLIMESPTAFRRRMIFVGSDPLYRPRRDSRGPGETVSGRAR